ncbi:pentatricopeptide repeat-containing protein At1g08070, chloroplastic-like [Actinidia eriantha]|uniref:pentatricopeptide repeat-containing protein At1g08070, chloroplastic-like n=1 Tax=Actinidia eriantha TaxID=165200 RepID=UPI002590C809|nr:pentatricopeptide repeat-containing protein At1g08070, chloroplastic-like [Actinidia eriantha]
MALSLPLIPAKTLTATTIITQFPENPKTLNLKQCKTIKELNQIHAHIIKTHLLHNPRIAQTLLESAAIVLPEPMNYAISIFDKLEEPDSSDYNIMIRGFTSKQSPNEALILFKEMCEKSVQPDEFTFPCILKACSRVHGLKEGMQIHGHVMKSGFGSNGLVQNTLIHLYGNCGEIGVARHVFDAMSERNVITWNSMIAGYTRSGCWEEVVELFRNMIEMDVGYDVVTLVCVLTACGRLADVELGEWVDEYAEVNGLKGNPTLVTSLVDMYAKCDRVETARRLFDQMPQKDVVAWSAMISGYSQANQGREALALFHKMRKTNVEPNEVTMVSVLSSCAVLGALETGEWVHSYIKKKRMKLTVNLGTALVDFYVKCGSLESGIEVFKKMPSRNVLSWTVLIQGLASNGQGKRAIEFFNLMLEENIKPNDVTFLGVLCACNHAGLFDEGRGFLDSMSRDFDIEPRIEHYGSMVDILGRAGLIEEAYQFIKNMPIEPNAVIWRTLLASCKIHKNVEIGEESLQNIVRLEPAHSGDYVLLSNIYASVGRWEDALRVKIHMKDTGVKKTLGCSLIELDGTIHEFFAEDNLHPHSEEIYNATEDMMKQIKLAGYVPNAAEAKLDAEEDNKEAYVSHHSEKLAIAFGLIRTSPGTTIRISKNLRVCTDCHNVTKMVSKVFNREIVIRARNRFHHFKDGACSCMDYW